MGKTGKLLVVSGPSGVGKGTIVSGVTEHLGETVKLSISATTREPRQGEQDGVHYHFLSGEEFLHRVEKGEFLEYASVHGHYYGTPRRLVEEALDEGRDVILEIEIQGALRIRELMPEAILVFVTPPSAQDRKSVV